MNDPTPAAASISASAVRPAASPAALPAWAQALAEPRCAQLGAPFFREIPSTPLPAPRLVHLNAPLATSLQMGEDAAADRDFVALLAGNREWPDYRPLASVYAGHQFGAYVPQLGDGRALLIAELRDAAGERQELQLKGAGPTPYSRMGDGRAVLRSSIREYLGSEAMHALGVPTTRALSLIASTEPVQRETLETAAVVCRVAPSFIRFGHFEYYYHRGRHAELRLLADHVIATHYPQHLTATDRYAAWLSEVITRTAQLMAHWQTLGFCHGVMNTDNFSILGLTLDYGPYGFIDGFNAQHVCNHSDDGGRYAYDQQPGIGHWNCSRLLQATLPLLDDDAERAVEKAYTLLEAYAPAYAATVRRRWADKLGLRELREEPDSELINRWLTILHRGRNDFTRSFRRLAEISSSDAQTPSSQPSLRDEITDLAAFDAWLADYRARLRSEQSDDAERAVRMNAVNPCYVLRNHLAQAAIARAEHGDDSEIARLMRLLAQPYTAQPGMDAYAAEPPAALRHIEVSCSS